MSISRKKRRRREMRAATTVEVVKVVLPAPVLAEELKLEEEELVIEAEEPEERMKSGLVELPRKNISKKRNKSKSK
jgi:hypothetical protein